MILGDVAVAFGAGVLTVASPCVLPVLPIVFGASLGRRNRVRPLLVALGFVAAFTLVALGLRTSSALLGLRPAAVHDGASLVLVLFGIAMLWPAPFERVTGRAVRALDRIGGIGGWGGEGHLGAVLLGMSLGVVWTPCAGPVLGAILTLVATAPRLDVALVMLLGYALGAGVPMLGIAYGGQWATARVRRLTPLAAALQRATGAVVIAVALAIYWQWDAPLVAWLSRRGAGS